MTLTRLNYINMVIVLETLIAGHIMGYYLPKRDHFITRLILSSVLSLAAGLLFYVPWLNSFNLNVLYSIFMYTVLALIPAAAVFACRKMSVWEFLFCFSGGHALHQLAGQIRSFIVRVSMIEKLSPDLYQTLDIIIWVFIVALTYLIFFTVFVLKEKVNKDIYLQRHRIILLNLIVILIDIVLASYSLFLTADAGYGVALVLNGYSLVSVLLELIVMFSYLAEKRLTNELEIINALLKNSAKQYEMSKQNIDMINIKCHDMKRRIDKLSEEDDYILASGLRELRETISIYDSVVKTGNDVLDVILTENSLICERNGITFSVVADGKVLDFISPYDLYCLFDNAISNAIEAVMKLDNVRKREISLVVKGNQKMASIHIENFFSGDLKKEDDDLLTSKPDETSHGFGTKSMKAIVEKYQGTISFSSEDNIFMLDILIPLSSKAPQA